MKKNPKTHLPLFLTSRRSRSFILREQNMLILTMLTKACQRSDHSSETASKFWQFVELLFHRIVKGRMQTPKGIILSVFTVSGFRHYGNLRKWHQLGSWRLNETLLFTFISGFLRSQWFPTCTSCSLAAVLLKKVLGFRHHFCLREWHKHWSSCELGL